MVRQAAADWADLMKWIIRASDGAYRAHIQDEADGRLPLAWLTFGSLTGHGWGFLHPWEQKAIFPAKGTPLGFGDPWRAHEPFWILRVRPLDASFKHANHDYYIEGRYWYGWAWREAWGKRWGFWPLARWVLLDPDIVTHDPGKADDWDERDGEDW